MPQRVNFGEYGGVEYLPDGYTLDQIHAEYEARKRAASGGRSYGRLAGDLATKLAEGVVSVPEMVTGVLDIPTLGLAGKALGAAGVDYRTTREYLSGLRSPEYRAAEARAQHAEGIGDTVGEYLRNPELIAGTAIESVPSMLAGGAIGGRLFNLGARGLTRAAAAATAEGEAAGASGAALAGRLKAAETVERARQASRGITAAAIGEGVVSAGLTAEQIRQESESGFLTPKQVALSVTTGLGTVAAGRYGAKLAERLGVIDPDVLFTAGRMANPAKRDLATRIIAGAVSEGVFEELPQTIQETIQQNWAQGKRWDEGLTNAAVLGTLSGALMGGLANVRKRWSPPETGGPDAEKTRTEAETPRPPAGPVEGEVGGVRVRDVEKAGVEPAPGTPQPPQVTGVLAAKILKGRGVPDDVAAAVAAQVGEKRADETAEQFRDRLFKAHDDAGFAVPKEATLPWNNPEVVRGAALARGDSPQQAEAAVQTAIKENQKVLGEIDAKNRAIIAGAKPEAAKPVAATKVTGFTPSKGKPVGPLRFDTVFDAINTENPAIPDPVKEDLIDYLKARNEWLIRLIAGRKSGDKAAIEALEQEALQRFGSYSATDGTEGWNNAVQAERPLKWDRAQKKFAVPAAVPAPGAGLGPAASGVTPPPPPGGPKKATTYAGLLAELRAEQDALHAQLKTPPPVETAPPPQAAQPPAAPAGPQVIATPPPPPIAPAHAQIAEALGLKPEPPAVPGPMWGFSPKDGSYGTFYTKQGATIEEVRTAMKDQQKAFAPPPAQPAQPPPAEPAQPPKQPYVRILKTPTGTVSVIGTGKANGAQAEVEYVLMEADDVAKITVMNVGEDQTRQRQGSISSEDQINDIANNPDMVQLSDSPVSNVGAPVVDDVVLAGNARASGLVRGYQANTPGMQRYRAQLNAIAARLGVNPAGFTNPILVRRIRKFTRGTREQFVIESNPKYGGLPESGTEEPRLDGMALNWEDLKWNDSGNLTTESADKAAASLAEAGRLAAGPYNAVALNKRVKLAVLAALAKENNIPFRELAALLELEQGQKHVNELIRFAPFMVKLDSDLSLVVPWMQALRQIQAGVRSVRDGAYNSLAEWNTNRKLELPLEGVAPETELMIEEIVKRDKRATQIRGPIARYLTYAQQEQAKRSDSQLPELVPQPPRQKVAGPTLARRAFEEVPPGATAGEGVQGELREEFGAAPPPIPWYSVSDLMDELVKAVPAFVKPLKGKQRATSGIPKNYVDRRKLSAEDRKTLLAKLEQLQDRWAQRYKADPTFTNLFPIYLYSQLATGEGLASTYIGNITHFNGIMADAPRMAGLDLSDAATEDINVIWGALRDDMQIAGEGASFSSRLNTITSALYVTGGMRRIKGAQPNPAIMSNIARLPSGKYVPPGLKVGEKLQRLFDTIRSSKRKNAEDAADLAEFLAYTGLRISEAFDFVWKNVDWARGTIRVEDPRKQQKGVKLAYDFVLPPAALNLLQRLRDKNPPATGEEHVIRFMDRSDYSVRNDGFNQEHLSPASGEYTRAITSKDFRHFWTTQGAKQGIDKLWMGAMHGRTAQAEEGTGAQHHYIRYEGTPEEARAEADKFKFGTAADQGPPSPGAVSGPAASGAGRRRRTVAPQTELPGAEEVFNLAGEVQEDPERVAREKAIREQAEREALEAQQRAQPELPGMPPASEEEPPPQQKWAAPPSFGRLPEGEGLTAEEVMRLIRDTDRGQFPVKLVTTAELARVLGLPPSMTEGYNGAFDNGTIYLVPENLPRNNLKKIGEVVRHEGAHGVIRTPEGMEMIGNNITQALNLTPEELDAILDKGYRIEEEQRKDLRDAGWTEAQIDDYQKSRAYDEFFAMAREKNQSLWQKIVEYVKTWLSNRFGLKLSNEEAARALLRAVESKIAEGNGRTLPAGFQFEPRLPRSAASGADGRPRTHNIAGREFEVAGNDGFTQEQLLEAESRVADFFRTSGLPGQRDTTIRGAGRVNENIIWQVVPDGQNYDAEARARLIPEINRALSNKNTIPDHAYLLQLMNMVRKNFRRGNWTYTPEGVANPQPVLSDSVLREIMEKTGQEASWMGTVLNALTAIGESGEEMARNTDFYLRRIWADQFGGEQIRGLIERVTSNFRQWFTEAELENLVDKDLTPANIEGRRKLQEAVTKLMGLNRAEQGDRVYRYIQRLFKPKFAKKLAMLESNKHVEEAANEIIEQLAKLSKQPIPPVGPGKLSPLRALALFISEDEDGSEADKVDAAIRIAIATGYKNAGIKYALSLITQEEERSQAEQDFQSGVRVPTQQEIEQGLKNPEYEHWKLVSENLQNYKPITAKLAEDIVNEFFSGVQRADMYGRRTKPDKPEKRFNLNELAKRKEEYVVERVRELLALIEAEVPMKGIDPATRIRIGEIIVTQVEEQIRLAQDRFLKNLLEPKTAKPAASGDDRLQQILNAKILEKYPKQFKSKPVQDILQKVAREVTPAQVEYAAGEMNIPQKVAWIEDMVKRLIVGYGGIGGYAELANLAANDPNRLFAEQVVRNDITARVKAAEMRTMKSIFEGPDVQFPGALLSHDEFIKKQEDLVDRLNKDADRLKNAVNKGLLRGQYYKVEGAVNKAVIQKNLPSLNHMIQQALNNPITRHEEIAENFADQFVKDLNISDTPRKGQTLSDRDRLADLVEKAYGNKFREARRRALETAVKNMTPQQLEPLKKNKSKWEKIVNLVHAGGMDEGTILEALAKERGWKFTPAVRDRFKELVRQLDALHNLSRRERDAVIAKIEKDGPAPDHTLQLALQRAAAEKFASLEPEKVRIKREIEARWASVLHPVDLKTRQGRQNAAAAAMEVSAATLLTVPSFVFKQALDIITQGVIHTPTRAIGAAMRQFQQDKIKGNPASFSTFYKDAVDALGGAYRTRFANWRAQLSSAAAALKGSQDARNVERLLSGIAAFDRADLKIKDLQSKGRHAEAFALQIPLLMRWSFRIAQAFDAVHGTPAEFQEMRQQAVNHLINNGQPRSRANALADEMMGEASSEWNYAMQTAAKYLTDSRVSATQTDIRAAATALVKARAYQRMAEAGLPADEFEERARLVRNTIGWNERETGGLGGVASASFLKLRELSQNAPLPFSLLGSVFNFGNAIGTNINRVLSFTPMGFLPQLFGVTREEIEGGRDSIHGSPWYRTPTDRLQRKVEATAGSAIGGMLFVASVYGILKVRLRWPEDKEERELWIKGGHTPGTVELTLDDGKFIPFSLTSGPFAVVRPYLAAGGALNEALEKREKLQLKLNAEAARLGVAPGKVDPLSWADMIGVAGEAARGAVTGGRTAAGLIGAFSDYGTPNIKKGAATVVSSYVPGLPALQQVSRMAGTKLDSKLASFMDFLVPLPTSQAAAVNLLGDKVSTSGDVQRVIQTLTGGNYPGVVSSKELESVPAYKTLFNTGYRPPSINSNQGYMIGNDYRPLSNNELAKYSRLRGEYFKDELIALGEGATKDAAQDAFTRANQKALGAIGARRMTMSSSGGSVSGGSVTAGATSTGSSSSRPVGAISRGAGRLRSSFSVSGGGGRSSRSGGLRMPKLGAPRLRQSKLRSVLGTRRRLRRRRTRMRSRIRASYA